jgi:1,4-alpha-glucan branching enzyme
MSTVKTCARNQASCKVKFTLNREAGGTKKTAFLVGDFNGWDKQATPMKKMNDGSFTVTVTLQKGKKYQYRYLLDGTVWENDWKADAYVPNQIGGGDNSVVQV